MIGRVVSSVVLVALFIGSVAAAGATVGSSYQSAQLEHRFAVAQTRQRILEEQLAQAQSLQLVVGYAQEQGYIEAGARSSIQVAASLAQR